MLWEGNKCPKQPGVPYSEVLLIDRFLPHFVTPLLLHNWACQNTKRAEQVKVYRTFVKQMEPVSLYTMLVMCITVLKLY